MAKRSLVRKLATLEIPILQLRGENLEYYKNIEYLKEMTRQANALLDRSNAKYENILDDHKLGYVQAKSPSNSSQTPSAEAEGRCRKCGLSHGAADFCIVEQIMIDEKTNEDNRRSKWSEKTSVSLDLGNKLPPSHDASTEISVQDKTTEIQDKKTILDKMTPSQVLDRYEALCFRYGPDSGRKFLLVNSLQRQPEGEILKWTTPRRSDPKPPNHAEDFKIHYRDITEKCASTAESDHHQCPDKSQDAVKKMEQLVRFFPPCQTQMPDVKKKWRQVFKNVTTKQDASTKPEEIISSERIPFDRLTIGESCQCNAPTCTCHSSKKCTTLKMVKTCNVFNHEEDHDNNYLLNMRRKIWERREAKRKESQILLRNSENDVAVNQTKSDVYLAGCREQQYKSLKECMSKKITGYDESEFDEMVKLAAKKTAVASPIDYLQLENWNEQTKREDEEMDEMDSLPSDIPTDEESSLFSGQSEVDFGFNGIKRSRIPYAGDVYDLIDNLYDKITRKFEKSILKNSFKPRRQIYRPTYVYLHSKFNIMAHRNLLFKEIMLKSNYRLYAKRLTPFSIRRQRKLKRLEDSEVRIQRAAKRRNMTRGLQLGKKYRKVSVSRKFTLEGGYSGFTPQQRMMLDPKRENRFDSFNLIGDGKGRAITVKRITRDYKLMSSMFDVPAKTKREDLIDEGMQTRLREFQRKLYSTLPVPPGSSTDEDIDFTDAKRKTTKEEMLLLQKANTIQPKLVTFSKSDENMPNQQSRLTNFGKRQLEDSLKTPIPSYHKKEKGLKTEKSTSNTAAKDKNTEDPGSMRQTATSSKPRGVRSVTNLLPEHKSSLAKTHAVARHQQSVKDAGCIRVETKRNKGQKAEKPSVKLPKLKEKARPKSNRKTLNNESSPAVKHRESIENLKSEYRQGNQYKKSLVQKMSGMDVNMDRSAFLVKNASESSPKTEKPTRISISTAPKQAGFKAWR